MKQYDFNKTRLQEQPRDYYRKLSEEEKQGGGEKDMQRLDIRRCLMK